MRIVHRIGMADDDPIRTQLQLLGYEFEEELTALLVEESDSHWPAVKRLIAKYAQLDIVTTEFSPNEIESAEFLELAPAWHHGYPQPEGEFGYERITYDSSTGCFDCGCRKQQISPFRFKREPKWGRRGILQLNWVYDEYFVLPAVWEDVFRPFGIGAVEVLHAKTETPLKSVVQLSIPHEDVVLDLSGRMFERCDVCGSVKYLPITRGYFPKLIGDVESAMFRSKEYFGSGGSAFNAIIITQELCSVMREKKLRGVHFKPLLTG